ncbi:MAG: protein kinase [Gemmatimonadaceae bacterium]
MPVDPVAPEVIGGRYKVERLLGRGGMATVYLCADSTNGHRVAVKVLREEIGSAVVVERFLREIVLASDLEHPRIPRVLDSGVIGQLPFYVMTYIEGESLRSRLDRERQLPLDEAIRITNEVAGPMAHAHALGIVHRDIKPANILLAPDAVYVLDFGVARAIVESADERLTSTGVAVGTPAYMSPEQALADKIIDGRSDIYSLGCVTYEMIAGIPPFVGATAQAVMARRFVAAAPPLTETREGIPENVQTAVAKALMKAPADRWQTVEQYTAALSGVSADAAATRLTSIVRRLRRRKRLLAAVVGVPVILATSAAIISLSGLVSRTSHRPAPLDPTRVAVLYFDDHSSDQSLGPLANSLTEGLIQELSSARTIKVISRNGVKPFRDNPPTIDSIARVLSTGTMVEGSIQKSGDRLRVTVEIVDATTSTRLDSKVIERKMGELFLLEDELAQEVAGLLRRQIGLEIRLKKAEEATTSVQARDLVMRANEARDEAEAAANGDSTDRVRGFSLLHQADSMFAEAERHDPKWPGPVIGRGLIDFDKAMRQPLNESDQSFRDAIVQANKVLARDPNNADALELRGTTSFSRATRLTPNDSVFKAMLGNAEADLARAVSLQPTLASAWLTLSRIRVSRGDLGMAEHDAITALQMDAYLDDAPRVVWSLYLAYLMGDRAKDAWRWCKRGARDFPTNPQFIDCQLALLAEDKDSAPRPKLAWQLVGKGDSVEPLSAAVATGRPYLPFHRRMLAAVVSARAGQKDSARAVAARARSNIGNTPILVTDLKYDDAFLQLTLGDRSAALKLLSEYLSERPSRVGVVAKHPRWKPLRGNKAFTDLVSLPHTVR